MKLNLLKYSLKKGPERCPGKLQRKIVLSAWNYQISKNHFSVTILRVGGCCVQNDYSSFKRCPAKHWK